jgi:beta-lactamase regulating signal transducer with metallopeptidase domain
MTGVMILSERAGEYVLNWTWEAAAVVLLGWGFVLLDRRNRPSLRCGIWSATLIGILLLPWAPKLVASFSWTQQLKQSWIGADNNSRVESEPSPNEILTRVTRTESIYLLPRGRPDVKPIASRVPLSAIILRLAGLSWFIGAVLTGIRFLATHRRLRRITRRGLCISAAALTGLPEWPERIPPIVLSSEVREPMLFGWFNPVILAPENLFEWSSPEERMLMIRHECEHYHRRDHWISAVTTAVRTALFFHPLVHLACREFAIARELVCDERVLRLGFQPQAYAETLIKVAEHAMATVSTCGSVAFASAAALDTRVDRLFRPYVRVVPAILVLLPAFLLLMPPFALGFWQASMPLLELLPPIMLVAPAVTAAPAPTPEPLPRKKTTTTVPSRSVFVQQVNAALPPAEPLAVRVDQLKVTPAATLVLMTAQIPTRDLTFVAQSDSLKASGDMFVRVTNGSNQIVSSFVDRIYVSVPAPPVNQNNFNVYQKVVPLPPGLYKLDVFFSDGARVNTRAFSEQISVQRFPEGFSATSPILARKVQVLPSGPQGVFQIGNFKVLPNVTGQFRRDEDLNFVVQIYGLTTDAAFGRPATASIETLILRNGTEVRRLSENVQSVTDLTMSKTLPLSDFESGDYSVQVTITDANSAQTVTTRGAFTVQ